MANEVVRAPKANGRRARRWQELHQRIFETARDLFLEQGFDATTVEQIADAADIAQATFFNHFPTKEDVLREMAREVFVRFSELIEAQRKRPGTTRERLLRCAERGAHVIETTPELTRCVLVEAVRTATRPGLAAAQLLGIRDFLMDLIRDGQKQGDVRTDLDAEFMAEIVGSVFHGTVSNWISDASYPLRKRLRESVAFISDSLEPPATAGKRQ